MKLTSAQNDAIKHAGRNLQLIACAGSGKTEVVAHCVAKLLHTSSLGLLTPRNIIAFTYTEKAAAELKERIITRCRESLGSVIGLAEMYVGTIHAFCLELLKTETTNYLKYEVLNEVQQSLFIDRHSKISGLTTSTDLNGIPLKRYQDTSFYLTALSILRENELDEKSLSECSVIEGLKSYQALLDDSSFLDYSAILKAAVNVMTNDDGLRGRLAERIRYVIVDEYQDVNPIQEAIIRLLYDLGAKVCVVGDDDQSIYQWRGSDIKNILTFPDRYSDVKPIKLELLAKVAFSFQSPLSVLRTSFPRWGQDNAVAQRIPLPPSGERDREKGGCS